MSALSAARVTDQWDQHGPYMFEVTLPVAASTKIWSGAHVDVNAGGYAVPAATNTTATAAGRAMATVDNTSGGNGDRTIVIRRGVFKWDNSASGDLIAAKDSLKDCYVVDDHTVALTSDTDARHKAGKIMGVAVDGGVWVQTVFY